jgi:hypothetical protein
LRSTYQILFSIELLNRFFNTGRWNNVTIIPLPETEKAFRNKEYSFRQIGNELLVIGKVDSSGKVVHAPQAFEKFSFRMIPQTPNYLNFTNFPVSELITPVFYFHNLNGNEFASKHFLSEKIKLYNSSVSYSPGDFAQSLVDGKVYECIRVNPSGVGSIAPDNSEPVPPLPPAPADKLYSGNFWALLGDMQFASTADTKNRIATLDYNWENTGGIYNFKTTLKQKQHTIQVYTLNTITLHYDKMVISNSVKFEDNNDMVQVDLRSLNAGAYCIQVNDDLRFVWLNEEGSAGNGTGMYIDIFNLPATNPQAYLDAGNKPKKLRYSISFAARRVLWQYNTRSALIDTIVDGDGNYLFESKGIKKFISQRPIPFSDTALKSLVAKSGGLSITSPLPNPQADRLSEKVNEIYTSESFINF